MSENCPDANPPEGVGEDHTVFDLRGFSCPLPVLKTRVRLKPLAPGSRAWVRTDDPLAVIDVPHFCVEAGQKLIRQQADDDGSHWFLVERGDALA